MEQAIVFIKNKLKSWKNPRALKVHFLEALFTLAQEKPTQNNQGFDSIEILEQMQKIRGKHWGPRDPEQISKAINRFWNQASELWKEKSEGIQQELSLKYELEAFPEIDKVEGGGKGNPSRYRVVLIEKGKLSTDVSNSANPYLDKHSINYICEEVSNPGFIAKIFANGIQVRGWRKFLLVSAVAVAVISLIFVLLVFFGQITFWNQFGWEKVFKTAIQFFVILTAVWLYLWNLIELPVKKIVPAPFWIQSLDHDYLLEHRSSPRHEFKTIKAVIYSANCPICSGRVTAKFSRFQFMGRIVGRCENAPVEHVFSFDHITRCGVYLR